MKLLISCFSLLFLFCSSIFALNPDEQQKVISRARQEVTRAVVYDASYRRLTYPGGDVPQDRGVCTDVVIRAFRTIGYDLQTLIYSDKKAHRRLYGGSRPDPNIDHRRCKNQMVYFRGHAQVLTKDPDRLDQWQPGDIVYWDLNGQGLLHSGIISDLKTSQGRPYVIHNIGLALEEDVLGCWKIIAHFRLPRAKPR